VTREEFVAQTLDKGQFGLEVGPSYNPTLRRADGWNVETIDHASADELREKYAHMIDTSQVEDVDYISDARPMHEVIARRGEYDFIFASHVIEHIPDMIGFFQSCEQLLKPAGRLILVVPDKRRCFDVMQARTMTGDILEAHRQGATRHSPGRAFDFLSNRADMGGHQIWESHWAQKFNLSFHFSQTIEQAKQAYDEAVNGADYVDIHAWRFVPSSFRSIMQDLERLEMTKLREVFFESTNRCEFYFTASPGGAGCPLDRMGLNKAIALEEIEGLMQIAASPMPAFT